MGKKPAQKTTKKKAADSDPLEQFRHIQGRQVALLNEVRDSAVTNWYKAGCPRNKDHSYDLQLVLRWLRGRAGVKKEDLDAGDPLDRQIKEEKLKIIRMTRENKERGLVRKDQMIAMLDQLAAGLRGLGEQMERDFGKDAHILIDEAIDSFERGIREIGARS